MLKPVSFRKEDAIRSQGQSLLALARSQAYYRKCTAVQVHGREEHLLPLHVAAGHSTEFPLTIGGFPKIMGTILGVPIIRIIVFWGLYWGPLILGNYHRPFGRCVRQVCGGHVLQSSSFRFAPPNDRFQTYVRNPCSLGGGPLHPDKGSKFCRICA